MAHGIAFSLVPHQLWNFWHTGPSDSTSFSWTASVLILSLVGLAWSLSRKSSTRLRTGIGTNGIAPVCPPEQLKDDLKGGVANAYALERELTVPFDVGDVRVSKILMHPIKSCRGTSLQEARYTPEGLEYDRKWCIVEAESHNIITAREVGKMVLITPKVEVDAASPYGGRLTVSFPADSDCETFSVPLNPTDDLLASWPVIEECRMFGVYLVEGYVVSSTLDGPGSRTPSEILSDYFGRAVYLVMKGPRPRECPPTQAFPKLQETAKFQDGYPFLVASQESLEEVRRVVSAFAQDESPEAKIGGIDRERWRDGGVEIERFRPNIVFKGSGVPFAEDMWRRVRIHPSESESMDASADEARTFTLVSKCTRCLLPNVDITTGARDAAVPYKVLLKFRRNKDPARMSKPCFGCNAVVGGTGVVRVGDRVEVLEWAGGIGV
ncbi:MOSC N-terminal beta barrel domain-containing protein [Cubamyces menziesii]|nr:MOSC N-terminal beta barrel domain-containing protein [Cubamyces menziesii]